MAPPVSPTKRQEETEQRRCTILQAARTVFARQGYAKTVVEDIANQAGIGKGTLYLYFRSKEEIYLAALLGNACEINRRSREAMAAAGTWREKLRAFIDVRLRSLDQQEQQDFFRVYLTEFRNVCAFHQTGEVAFSDMVQEAESQLVQMLAVAIDRGEVRPVDPALTAAMISDLTRGLIERRLRGWGRPGTQADEELVLDLLCRALEQ